MKIFKHRNLMGCIYSILIAIPFLSILATTAYVAVNKNAHESYYGETINEQQYTYTNSFGLKKDVLYYGQLFIDESTTLGAGLYLQVNELKIDDTEYHNVAVLRFWKGTSSNNTYSLLGYETFGSSTIIFDFSSGQLNNYSFIYVATITQPQNSITENYDLFYTIEYNKFSFMDNAFDYSLSKFVSANDFGKLNLFEWFWSIFLTNNSQNMLYIHFVNWYMNYALLVSSAYILFLVLMWFINFSRRILERGMNYDW